MRTSTIISAAVLTATYVSAQSTKANISEPCLQGNNHLDQESWSLVTDCVPNGYCQPDNEQTGEGTCQPKRCRRDIFPFGYNDVPFDQLPPMCADGYFCPDEGDQCLAQIEVGQACQKDRDDECQPPPNFKDLAGFLNTNGSVCLNFTCMYANASVGQSCFNDNTAYATYNDNGGASTFIISRDNCRSGLYCDGQTLQCFQDKKYGQACTGNKECQSYNCENGVRCGRSFDEPVQAPAYAYALIAVGIVLLILGTFIGLWFLHKRSRKENQIKLEQYYNEQIAYRQSLMSMSVARQNLAADARRSQLHDDSKGRLPERQPFMPPNMTRDSSAWSDSGSEILNEQPHHLNRGESSQGPMRGGLM